MNINKPGVGRRLALAFSAMLAIMVVLALVSLSTMGAIQDKLDRIVSVDNVKVRTILAANRAMYADTFKRLEALLVTPAEKAAPAQIKSGEREGANRVLLIELQQLEARTVEAMDAMLALEESLVAEAAGQAQAAHAAARLQTALLTLAALAIGAALAFIVTRPLLRRPVGEPPYAATIAEHIQAREEKPGLGRASVGQQRMTAAFAGEVRAEEC